LGARKVSPRAQAGQVVAAEVGHEVARVDQVVTVVGEAGQVAVEAIGVADGRVQVVGRAEPGKLAIRQALEDEAGGIGWGRSSDRR
jgi:hypothetical protein